MGHGSGHRRRPGGTHIGGLVCRTSAQIYQPGQSTLVAASHARQHAEIVSVVGRLGLRANGCCGYYDLRQREGVAAAGTFLLARVRFERC